MNSLSRPLFLPRSFHGFVVAVLCAAIVPLCAALDAPVSPGAQPAVGTLFTFLDQISGNYILSGQQERAWDLNGLDFDVNYVVATTGKTPVVRGFDFLDYCYSPAMRATQTASERAITWAQNGGIVTFCCHMFMTIGSTNGQPQFYVPASGPGGQGTNFDIRQAVINGTPENTEFLAKLDIIASELTKLRDAGVPVIWRPFHECSGGWFWWGAHGPTPFIQAYRIMFNRFTQVYGLNNLIWVFNPTDSTTNMAAWYPGDDVVDLISYDVYPAAGTHPAFATEYAQMRAFKSGRKVVTMSENGAIPDPNQLFTGANWAYFCTWNGFENDLNQNSVTFLQTVYNHPKVITLDELPPLYVLFPVAFTAQPGNQTVAAGGSASFIAVAAGTPAPIVQWQRLPAGSGAWANVSEGGDYSGATKGTLVVSNSTTGMSGDQFRCVAANSLSSAISNAAVLVVLVAPSNAVVTITVE